MFVFYILLIYNFNSLRLWLSGLERFASDEEVGGSSPSRRTQQDKQNLKLIRLQIYRRVVFRVTVLPALLEEVSMDIERQIMLLVVHLIISLWL